MKFILSTFIVLLINFSAFSQQIFTQGDHNACKSDSIFKNSPLFNENGKPPSNNDQINFTKHFQDVIGKIKTHDRRVVFKFILDCNGSITDIWIYKSSGIKEVDNEILSEIKKLKNWTPATFNGKNVDFEMTLLGAIRKHKLFLGTQMQPPKEWAIVK